MPVENLMDTNPETEVADAEAAVLDLLNEPTEEAAEQSEATEAAEQTDEQTTEEPEAEDSEQEQPEAEADEVELDGEKFKVPKKVAEAVLRNKDYTQKTQAVAERARVVEDREQYVEAREVLLKASAKELGELQALQSQLAQFESVDWNALIAEDSNRAIALHIQRADLQQKLQQKAQAVQAVVAQAQTAKEQHRKNQIELGRSELERRIGKLTATDREATFKQALELGFSEKEVAEIADPRLMHAVWMAAKWQALQKAKPQAMKKVVAAPPAVKPAAAPARPSPNQSALERLKKSGRPEDLARSGLL